MLSDVDLMTVSIHAPREGCDAQPLNTAAFVRMFQFTHPGRGATATSTPTIWLKPCFNSRTPGGVRPQGREIPYQGYQVSIHAPREGCDRCLAQPLPKRQSFNSRTPGGVRRLVPLVLPLALLFQFTHPGRGATHYTNRKTCQVCGFQFTHPGRGAT